MPVGESTLRQNLDIAANTAGLPDPTVGGQQQSAQRFRQGNVGGVVRGEIVAKPPSTGQQRQMRNASQRKSRQVVKRLTRPPLVEPPTTNGPTKGRQNLEIDELRRHKLFPAQAQSSSVPIGTIVSQCRRQHRGVDDDHAARLRSALSASAEKASPTDPPARPPARSSTSSRVSSRACCVSCASRYSCNDCPAPAARWRRTRCTSGGTFLIWTLGIYPA